MSHPPIKVLYLDPISTPNHLPVFENMVRTYKYNTTDAYVASLNPNTVPKKMTNLEYRTYETFTELDTLKTARYCANHDFDAMVIGCFYDPCLLPIREIAGNCTVVAPCQSACQLAVSIANTFSVIIGRHKWEYQMKSNIHKYGYGNNLASFESTELHVEEFQQDPKRTKKLLFETAVRAVEKSRAESIILGCTMETGFYLQMMEKLEQYFGFRIPVIDSAVVAFKTAEDMARKAQLGWKNSHAWGMAPPPKHQLKAFGILQEPYEFDKIIHIPPSV